MNLPNVTLSNTSHLICITFFGETDGVTLSRLDGIYIYILFRVPPVCVGEMLLALLLTLLHTNDDNRLSTQ